MHPLRRALLQGRRRPRRFGSGSPLNYRGDGYEFVELREYVPGDDVRRIDWAATARTAQLQTRVLLEDVALTLGLLVDDSPAMQLGRNVPLAQAAEEIGTTWFAAAEGTDRAVRVGSFDEALAALPRGAALLWVASPRGLPALSNEALYELAYRFDCTALLARDPWQDDLPLSGFVDVEDVETGETAQLWFGKRERERYMRASREMEARSVEAFTAADWRVAMFTEEAGAGALFSAFGL